MFTCLILLQASPVVLMILNIKIISLLANFSAYQQFLAHITECSLCWVLLQSPQIDSIMSVEKQTNTTFVIYARVYNYQVLANIKFCQRM